MNAEHLYWTQSDSGSLFSVSLAGGAVTTVSSGNGRTYGVALDSTRVYWSTSNAIRSLPLSGSGPVVTHATGQRWAYDLAVDSNAIYWSDWTAGTVMKVAK